jgi:hypothetical protein
LQRAGARAIIDANLYMVIGTADEAGRPWVSPVYYASAAYREFFWVSSPDTTHSRNLAGRPDVSIVIFDSSVPISTGQGVYMSASAGELVSDERAEGIDVFSRRALAHGETLVGARRVRNSSKSPKSELRPSATASSASTAQLIDRG